MSTQKRHEDIVITGSLAYDHIMSFQDQFKNHILPDKIPVLSVSFLVDQFRRNFGGTAGNIAYTAHLLGLHPTVVAVAGDDFGPYEQWLRDNALTTAGVKVLPGTATAQAFIITDRDNSQITAFHPGSMTRTHECSLAALPTRPTYVVIAPAGVEGMNAFVQECKQLAIPYLYDPGQGITQITPDELRDGMLHATAAVLNEYELAMVTNKIGMTETELRTAVPTLIVTYGAQGSVIHADGTEIRIPIAPLTKLVDPTGCGDAYRAGLLFGQSHGCDWEVSGRIAALAASYCAEVQGTQNHSFTFAEFAARYEQAFGTALNLAQ